jgi:hypothetical protein
VLSGIGEAAVGEWWERGDVATHLRRRLTAQEAEPIGAVRDVRGTADARRRLDAMWRYLPEVARAFAVGEANEGRISQLGLLEE